MKSIGGSIADGAMAFLKAEYRILAVFVIAVAFILGYANSGRSDSSAMISLSFVVGALASGLAGFLGMKVATKANNRTTHAAESSLAMALNVAFSGGSVMGLGVVGLGAIGSLVAEMALTFGMNVIGYDPAISVEAAWRLSSKVKRSNKISNLFAKSDYVTLHLPAIEATHHFINQDLLSHCNKDICLLNFSRSEIVDPMAIQSALESEVMAKYISDFPEPALLKSRGTIFLPHIGASTKEAEANCAIMAVSQLRDFLETGSITNSVNFPNVNLEYVPGCRIAITNENVPKILGSVLSVFANENINVIDMLNKSRDSLAYNLIDLDRLPTTSSLDQIKMLEGISNVRVVY